VLAQKPDLVLSLGTSTSPQLQEMEILRSPPDVYPRRATDAYQRRGIIAYGRNLKRFAKDFMFYSINCERIWLDYIKDVSKLPGDEWSRYIRINPEVNTVPKLDDVAKVTVLREEVRECMDGQPTIKQLAARLVCSSFYFELVGAITELRNSTYTARGKLQRWITGFLLTKPQVLFNAV
jgi:hypothetical protein